MTLSETYRLLETVAQAQPNINTIVSDFLDLNREDTKYSAIVIQEREHQNIGEFISYSFFLGYVDRLTDDKMNEILIHSTGINILKNIVNLIKDKFYPTIDITAGRFITFTQRFTAECAGVYTDIVISVPVSECPDFDFHLSDVDLRPATFTDNGVYEPVGFDGYSKVTVEVEGGGVPESWVKEYTYSKGETDEKIIVVRSEIPTKVSQLTNDAGYLTEHQSLADYALKSEIPSLTGYATESWVEGKGYLTEHQSLADYALKSEIPSLSGYATESWVEGKGYLTEHQSLVGYATESWVNERLGILETITNEILS